jgi:hypothetical protein
MENLQLTLTAEERDYLVTSLETSLKERRIEEHRTRTPTYREHVIHQEEVITGLLNKLRQPPPASGTGAAAASPAPAPEGIASRAR